MDHRNCGYFVLLVVTCLFYIFTFVEAASPEKIVTDQNDASLEQNGTNNLDIPLPDVILEIKGLTAILYNGLINITFQSDATVSSLYKNGKNLVENVIPHGTFYLDWFNGNYGKFSPTSLQLLSKSPERAHIMYLQNVPGFLEYEYHIIMEKGLSGLYTYVKATNNKHHPLTLAETRIIYRFNPKMRHVTNSVQEGILPDGRELSNARLVQDTTWRLPDGTYYSKYDYAGYIRNTPYMGVFENKGYGAWLISANRDYHSGGPLKQDLLIHQDALIANYMTGSHFGTPDMCAPAGWSKIYGPWLVYFNSGTADEMELDTIRQTKVEQNLWPYTWMNETDYPLKRGQLTGKVTSPVRSTVVLSSSLTEEFDLQTLGFSYFTKTDNNGDFQLEKIRPGTYKLTAYPIEGYGIGVQTEKLITISEGKNTASLDLPVPTEVMWSIGETNRRSDSYRYSNEERNYLWHTLSPANLEFKIGKSKIDTDWYYAQTKPGTWNIKYNDTPNGKNRILRIGIAAASNARPSPPNDPGFPVIAVSVNGHLLKEFHYVNDKSVYRSAPQSGNYHAENIVIPGNFVTKGYNVIGLTLRQGSVMYDSVNLSDEKDD